MTIRQKDRIRVGIDVGGTFTDLVGVSEYSENVQAVKTLSTSSPADGILAALRKAHVNLADVETFVFGSTIAINALVEKKYPKVGTINNLGFRDTLEIRRIWRQHLFGSFWERPKGMVPRRLRREVPGRINVDGLEVEPLDEELLLKEVQFLVDQGVESVAISFLHSHVNDIHERQALDLIGSAFPGLGVSISSEESSELGEYERLSTTVVAAALKPLIARELGYLVDSLREQGMVGTIHVMKSNGGVMSVEAAQRKPHELIQSGPSGGVSAARRWGAELGVKNLITIDVGGTTADISLIRDGRPTVARLMELDWDIPVRISLVDIRSVGAGGGSIAWVDAAGQPRLGPASAGSRPGPASMNRGGTKATVTDAALLAGWLNEENFAGGELELDRSLALQAFSVEGLQEALNADTEGDAGAGILALAASSIAEQIRALTVKHGEDPRDFSLLVYGGAGGLFGADVAEALGIDRVIMPPNSSVLSAWGGLLADEEHDYARTVLRTMGRISADEVRGYADAMLEQARLDFGGNEFSSDFMLDVRYEGQSHVLTIPLDPSLSSDGLRSASTDFENLHEQRYGHNRPEDEIEIHAMRLHARRRLIEDTGSMFSSASSGNSDDTKFAGSRRVHRYSEKPADWGIIWRGAVSPDEEFDGPLILEDDSSTIIVPRKWRVEIGPRGEVNLLSGEEK